VASSNQVEVDGRELKLTNLDKVLYPKAGFTKGAVYSNFAGKDELFVAVLAAHFSARVEVYEQLIVQGDTIEEAYRDVGRFMAEADRREPAWSPLLLEFWSHASRREELRRVVVAQREAFLETIAALIARLAAS